MIEIPAYFSWSDFIYRAIKNDLVEEEWHKAIGLSINWETCACGSKYYSIPRDCSGKPLDKTLKCLGDTFYEEIRRRRFIEANKTLNNIRMRALEITNSINYKIRML